MEEGTLKYPLQKAPSPPGGGEEPTWAQENLPEHLLKQRGSHGFERAGEKDVVGGTSGFLPQTLEPETTGCRTGQETRFWPPRPQRNRLGSSCRDDTCLSLPHVVSP